MAKKRFYVVWEGRETGVFDNRDDCMEQVVDFPGARYRGFNTPEEAAEAYRSGVARAEALEVGNLLSNSIKQEEMKKSKKGGAHPQSKYDSYLDIPGIDLRAWAVDASCLGNPGRMEYRGVDLSTGEEIFRVGPFDDATNNLGEFLAIVHALALMEKQGESHNIYSDSVSGMAWVRDRRIKTTLARTAKNERLFNTLGRAMAWLNTHSYTARVMKWHTDLWGEIPADFGRK